MAVHFRQLRLLVAMRLVIITSIGIVYVLRGLSIGGELPTDAFLYGLAGATYALSLVYTVMLRRLPPSTATLQAQLQFLGDVAIITGLVYYFGGASSSFSTLYLVVITAAATLLSRRRALVLANVSWIFYATLVWSLMQGLIPLAPGTVQASGLLTYSLTVHLLGFNAVAFLVSYLAQHATEAEVELERTTEDLAQLEHFHRDVTSSLASGLMTTDLEGRIVTVNPAGERILGRDLTAIAGCHIVDTGLLTAEQWRSATETSRTSRRRQRAVVAGDDGESHIGYSVTHLHHRDGTQRGFIVIFQDVTNWHQLEQQVRTKDRMAAIGELSAGLAHELGNPLAALSGSVQLLSSSLPESDESHRLLQIMLSESQRLDRIIKGFLRFARPGERVSSDYDVAALLSENIELLRNSDEVTPAHRLDVDLDSTSAMLTGDRDQISQIFWNLARNAIRAMPDGGRLLVTGHADGDVYRIRFRDNGKGMTDAERRALFQPFKTSFDGGTGIGMAIVYRIVQEHGGELSVESAPMLGTTVSVDLPMVAAEQLEPVEAWT
jgi:two-component system sensor histidine kinase PilS (NtrC family)